MNESEELQFLREECAKLRKQLELFTPEIQLAQEMRDTATRQLFIHGNTKPERVFV